MRLREGSLLTKPVPVLTMTSDQGSNLFATYVHLAYTVGLRLVYFPDINHIESNVENGIFEAINFGHLTEKSLFLSRLHHGPRRSEGRWHVQIKYAFKVGGPEAAAAKGKSDPGLTEVDGAGVAVASYVAAAEGEVRSRLDRGGWNRDRCGLVCRCSEHRFAAISCFQLMCRAENLFAFQVTRQVLQKSVRNGIQSVRDFLDAYAYDMCMDLGLPRPENQHTKDLMPRDLVLPCFVVSMFRITGPAFARGQANPLLWELVWVHGEGLRGWAYLPSAKVLTGSLSAGLAASIPRHIISDTDTLEWCYATSRLSSRTPRHTNMTSASGILWPTSSTRLGSLWQQLATSSGTSICFRHPT